MRKISRKHILGVLRDVSLSLYGRSPDSKMLLCRIAGFGYTNPSRTTSVKRRVKSHDKALEVEIDVLIIFLEVQVGVALDKRHSLQYGVNVFYFSKYLKSTFMLQSSPVT